ncbi:MAG: glycosyltransferase [Actinomycetota bacterium]
MIAQFLVNGAEGSAAGARAERIARAVGPGDAEIVYRDGSRRRAVAGMAKASRRARPRVIWAMDLAVAPVVAALTRSRGTKFVVDTGDSPAAFLEQVQAGRALIAIARVLERVGYGSADCIVVRGPYHAEQLRARGLDARVIPDGVDLKLFGPADATGLRAKMGLERKFTVGIQGHFTWYPALGGGLGWELVHAIALRKDLPIHALLIGSGPGLSHLRVLAEDLGVGDRVTVVGRVSYQDLALYLNACDVCLLTQTNDPSSWVRTTGKLPGYLACGRYILASRVGTAAEILPEEMLIDYEGRWDHAYPAKLAERFAGLIRGPERLTRGADLRGLAQQFDYERVAEEAAALVRSLAN